jgi:four helix bundle protein
MRNFRKLEVWIDARRLAKDVYQLSILLPVEEKFGLTSQVRRCAISVPANIAEGSAKESQRDFIRFLQISLGSLYELESHLILAQDLQFLFEKQLYLILERIQTLQKRIYALINYNRSDL